MKRLVGVSFLVIVIFCVLVGYQLSARNGNRLTIAEIVAALESGELKSGSTYDPARMPKPWIDDGEGDAQGNRFAVIPLRDSKRVLLLYYYCPKDAEEGTFYAACLLEQFAHRPVKWYFCDKDLLGQGVDVMSKKQH